jgi:Tol biopolymer transport system component
MRRVVSVGVALAAATSAVVAAAPVASAAPTDRYVAVSPFRLADSRTGQGLSHAGRITAGETLVLNPLGTGGLPASGVRAVALNVTVTDAATGGYLTVFPSDATRPTASSVNFSPGVVSTNAVVVGLDSGGGLSIYDGGGLADVIVDVEGYWPTGADFATVVPQRLLDTRIGVGALPGAVPAGGRVDLQVTGRGGVPSSGVGAVALNVTATQPTQSGYVTVFPTGATRPVASSLNFVAHQTIPNLVIVGVGTGGQVSLYNAAGSTQLLADVVGYWPTGSNMNGLTPGRVLDTRSGLGAVKAKVAQGHSVDVQVTGMAGVPTSGVEAVVLNVTVTKPASAGHVTVYPAGYVRPDTSNVNVAAGATRANAVLAKVGFDGRVTVFNGAGSADVIIDVTGYFAGPAASPGAAETALISATPTGDGGSCQSCNGYGVPLAMTPDGRYVEFASDSSNLVGAAPGTSHGYNMFVRDNLTGATALVSAGSDTQPLGNVEFVNGGGLTADGRYALYVTNTNGVVAADTNSNPDVYLRDLWTGSTTLVSVKSGGGVSKQGADDVAMSPDGRYVALVAQGTDMVPSGATGLFIRDRQTGSMQLVDANGYWPAFSADRGHLLFASTSKSLVPGDSNGVADVFEYDLASHACTRVSLGDAGVQPDAASRPGGLSSDGRYAVFSTAATTLASGVLAGTSQVYERDLVAGTTTLVSQHADGSPALEEARTGAVSDDGRYVVFASRDWLATDLTTPPASDVFEVFRRDMTTGTVSAVSRTPAGAAGAGSYSPLDEGSLNPIMSSDASLVAYSSSAANLIDPSVNFTGEQVVLTKT